MIEIKQPYQKDAEALLKRNDFELRPGIEISSHWYAPSNEAKDLGKKGLSCIELSNIPLTPGEARRLGIENAPTHITEMFVKFDGTEADLSEELALLAIHDPSIEDEMCQEYSNLYLRMIAQQVLGLDGSEYSVPTRSSKMLEAAVAQRKKPLLFIHGHAAGTGSQRVIGGSKGNYERMEHFLSQLNLEDYSAIIDVGCYTSEESPRAFDRPLPIPYFGSRDIVGDDARNGTYIITPDNEVIIEDATTHHVLIPKIYPSDLLSGESSDNHYIEDSGTDEPEKDAPYYASVMRKPNRQGKWE